MIILMTISGIAAGIAIGISIGVHSERQAWNNLITKGIIPKPSTRG